MGKAREIGNLLKRVRRFGLYVPLSSVALAVCSSHLPEKMVASIHNKRNAKIQKVLRALFKEKKFQPDGASLPPCERDVRGSYDTASKHPQTATIWVLWLQGEKQMPRLVKTCLNSIRTQSEGHPVVVLDKDNYSQYVTLNPRVEHLYSDGTLKAAHFADILRVNLLAQQGGLWLDATVMLTAPLSEEVWEKPFFTIKTVERGHFVSRCRWTVFCMGAKAGFPLFEELSEMIDRYLEKEKMFVDYFMFDHLINLIYEENADIRHAIDSIPRTNPQIYELGKILTSDYDGKRYQALTSDTSIFKLNRKAYSDEALAANPASYLAFLEKKYER